MPAATPSLTPHLEFQTLTSFPSFALCNSPTTMLLFIFLFAFSLPHWHIMFMRTDNCFLTVSAVSLCLEKGWHVVSARYLMVIRAGLSHPNPGPDPHMQPSRRDSRLVRADSTRSVLILLGHTRRSQITVRENCGSKPHHLKMQSARLL